ncbi:ATP-dependent DNA helicase RecG [Bifidobacterium phasiani]|uniref:ATP-dependent DNA helicase RecG n=1 Tax=Bifidobacterium phasiani TaxID=2834431 RepID=A0ABS6WC86_9BIFI|nr:ATP-dependent DNA helicase RecG [Bifidobacterium phasiani]MBW3083795.1 ATP-dependent DNA helicase RecG [Bifidobacterium phasiani]
MSVTLGTPISSLMTNRRRVGALKSLGVVSVGDALTYYPFRVTDPVPLRAIREARIGEAMAFAGEVRALRVVPMNARRGYRLEAVVDDAAFAASRGVSAAVARLVFFSYKKQYVDWMGARLRQGARVVVSGQPSVFNDQLQFTHPEVLTIAAPVAGAPAPRADAGGVEEALARVCRPRPVYHASSRISSDHIHDSILAILRLLAGDDGTPAPAPASATDAVPPSHMHNVPVASASAPAPEPPFKAIPAPSPDFSDTHNVSVEAPESDAAARGRLLAGLEAAIPDIIPESIRADKGLHHRAEAFLAIHDPVSVKDFHAAIGTLRYEEAFVCQTALLQARRHAGQSAAEPCADTGLRDAFIDGLPFSLTDGQRAVVDDIAADMAADRPMQRLLQGEVGSGKTVVAVAAMLQAVGSGHQAVLVAPTQVLAEQHHRTIAGMMDRLCAAAGAAGADVVPSSGDAAADSAARGGRDESDAEAGGGVPAPDSGAVSAADAPAAPDVSDARDDAPAGGGAPAVRVPPVILLTGGMKLAARRKALAAVASGEPCIVVATHAAFSKTFQAPNLALAVIDEQHRFGVEQRESLQGKAASGRTPHLLVMTATPIPRTAAMTWFGDLDISWLTELPGGRKPIRTFVIPESDGRLMASMFAHIRGRIDAGERAYVVCARIDESDDATEGELTGDPYAGESGGGAGGAADGSDAAGSALPPLHAVGQIVERLSRLPQFRGVEMATLTGRDDDATKQQVMRRFADGETPVLVATTVIEVGVDVPQASCIVVFDADRFGLSQLHQLRGRVGRGGTPSWAFLVSRAEPGSLGEQRLAVIRDTLDGAAIAEADLQLRGAGDVLGDAQSGGKSSLKLLRVVKDAALIADARERAGTLLAEDPELSGDVELAGAVLDFARGNETFLTST